MNPVVRNFLGLDSKAVRTRSGEPDLYGLAGGEATTRRLANRRAAVHTQAYGGSDAIDWVMDCVDLYAQTASNATYHFERDGKVLLPRKTDDDPDDVGEAPGDLAGLFERPNGLMDYTELIELSVIDILLAGEFFWLKFEPDTAGRPKQLYRLPPSAVDVIPGAVTPKGFVYNAPGGSNEPMKLAPRDVLHVKRPNPHDAWRGLGVIAGSPTVFDLELALTEQVKNYYAQGTKLSGVLETDRSLPETTARKILRRFEALYSGARNAGRVAMLERGLKFSSISATAEQAQYESISKMSEKRIAKMFRVPLPLLGDVGSADRQAVREAQRIFDNRTMRPFLNRLQSMISFGLTQAWGVDFVIEHEYVMPIEDKLDLAQTLSALPGVRVREVRAQVELPPLGDERDEIVLNLPGLDREDGGHPDRPLAEEAGRPPRPENTRPFPKPGQPMPASADASKAVRETLARARASLEEVNDAAS